MVCGNVQPITIVVLAKGNGRGQGQESLLICLTAVAALLGVRGVVLVLLLEGRLNDDWRL
jgi:hypothetical protein